MIEFMQRKIREDIAELEQMQKEHVSGQLKFQEKLNHGNNASKERESKHYEWFGLET